MKLWKKGKSKDRGNLKDKANSYEDSIFVENEIIQNNFKNRKNDYIIEFVLNYIGIWAMPALFLSAFEIEFSSLTYMVYMLAVSFAFAYIFNKLDKQLHNKIIIGFFVVFVVAGIVISELLIYSMAGLVNKMDIGMDYEKTFSSDFILIYLLIAVAAVMTILMYKSKKIYAVIFAALPLIPCIIFNRVPSAFSAMLLVVFILSQSIYISSGKNSDKFYYPCAVAGSIFVMYLLISFFMPEKDYKGETMWDNFWKLFEEKKEEKPIEMSLEIGGGKLGTSEELNYRNVKVLSLDTGYGGKMYLRGYLGNVYSDNGWKALTKEDYDGYEAVFDKSQYNIDIYNQTAELFSIIDNDIDLINEFSGGLENYIENVLVRNFTIIYEKNITTNYWYMPYGNARYVSKKTEADGYPIDCKDGAVSANQYVVKELDYDKFKALIDGYSGSNSKMARYINWENDYRKFVYDVYTRVDDDVKTYISDVSALMNSKVSLESLGDRLEYVAELKKYFEENFQYTLAPGKVPEGEDLIDYFLNDTKTGYCTYFASSAAQVLRNAGIPARYVEGYAITPENLAVSKQKITANRESNAYKVAESYTKYRADILDSYAHAWVEIYMDGYGWIPVEFTPGFTQADDVTDDTESTFEEKEEETRKEPQTTYQELQSIAQERETLYFKTHFDSIGEYMEHNRTGRLDFSIVFSILWKDFLELLEKLFYIAIVLLIIAVCFYVPAVVSERKRKELFMINEQNTPEADNEQVLKLFEYVDKVCRFLKVKKTEDMTCAGYVEAMKARSECFEKAKVENIIYSIEKISFGHGNIGKEEMKKTVEAAVMIRSDVYKELNRIEKLLYRFIWHLY